MFHIYALPSPTAPPISVTSVPDIVPSVLQSVVNESSISSVY